MASTVKIPILGTVNKGTAVGVGIGGVTVAGYLLYRQVKKSKTAAAAAQTSTAQQAAGYGYGYGSGPMPGGYYGYGEPGAYYGYGASGGFQAGYYGYGVPTPQPVANTTNAQWAQAAIAQLTNEGYDAQTVSAALGAYETGQPVTSVQQGIIQAAIGIEGYPPVAGANGFPPSINVQGTVGGGTGGGQGGGGTGTGGTGTGGTGGGTTVAVPNVVGQRAMAALNAVRAAGFKSSTSPFRNPIHEYTVTGSNPAAGTQAAPGSQVTLYVKQI